MYLPKFADFPVSTYFKMSSEIDRDNSIPPMNDGVTQGYDLLNMSLDSPNMFSLHLRYVYAYTVSWNLLRNTVMSLIMKRVTT